MTGLRYAQTHRANKLLPFAENLCVGWKTQFKSALIFTFLRALCPLCFWCTVSCSAKNMWIVRPSVSLLILCAALHICTDWQILSRCITPFDFWLMCYSIAFPNQDHDVRLATMLAFPLVCHPDHYCFWQCPGACGFSTLCSKSNQFSSVAKYCFSQLPSPGRITTMKYLGVMRTTPGKKATDPHCSYPGFSSFP